jgi:hypothetical protein
MNFQVNFSEAVEVGVAVRLRLNVGGQFRDAIAVSGNTTSSVIFRYEVQSVSEYDLNGISIVGFVSDPIGSPNYYIRSVATSVNADLTLPIVDTSGVLVNSLTPSITSITNNRTGENLSTGSVILFTVTYDYPIETTGSVQLDLEIGSTARYADILPSSDTFTRQFTYTIQSGDLDVDGLRIMSINLNGGSITSPAGVSADNSFSPIQTDVTVGSAPAPEWTIRTTPSGAWNRIIYGLDKFIVVGNNDAIMYSSDGITWSSSSFTDPVLSGANWQGVCYSPDLDKYVAVANTGTKRVATSLDGITWTLQDAAVNTTWISVAYGAGVFSAVSSTGTTNRIMYSSDGITWSTSGVTTGSVAIGTAYHITYQSGWFLISRENTSINESRIIKSTNGINYSNSLIQTGSQNPITTEVLYGTTHFVGVAKTGSARRSTDTSTWTTSAYPVLGVGEIPNTFQGLTYGVRPSNSTPYYFAVTQNRASSQVMYANADGSTWNILTSPPTTANGWRSIAYANGMLIIVNNGTYGSASQRVMTYNLI